MEDELWIALEFQTRFAADREAGENHRLAHYLAAFPGHEEVIAREFMALESAPQDHVEKDTEDAEEARVGPYRLRGEIGRGGQGIVYRAWDDRLQRHIALKVLHRTTDLGEQTLTRFQREATVVSGLDHPGICTVHDFGTTEGRSWIAMRLIEGMPFSEWCADEAPTRHLSDEPTLVEGQQATQPDAVETQRIGDREKRARETTGSSSSGSITFGSERERHGRLLAVMESAARALHAAHEAGIIHRDVKPANIMVDSEDRAILTDFGLARQVDSGHTLTMSGDLFGTPAYLAPEQLEGTHERVDHRADLWALGVVLYEAITRARPFEAPTREGLYNAILSATPRPPSKHENLVSRDLDVVVLTALQKDPNRRYQDARSFAEDIRRARLGLPVAARRISAAERLVRWSRNNPAVAGSLSLTLVTLIVALVVSLSQFGIARKQARTAQEQTRVANDALAAKARQQEQTQAALARAEEEKERSDQTLAEYEQLANLRIVALLLKRERSLWPIAPSRVASMESWIAEADRQIAGRARHQEAHDELALRELLASDETSRSERETLERLHPDFYVELERVRTRHAALIAEVRAGTLASDDPGPGRLAGEIAELEANPRFISVASSVFADQRDAWRFEALQLLLADLDDLTTRRAEVARRLEASRTLVARTAAEGGEAWKRCIADLKSSERFAELKLEALPGLVPLGKDRDSGLWEFWHMPSGDRPPWEGTLEAGRATMAKGAGLVLVLIPGGTHRIGAQRANPDQPHYDPEALSFEQPVHEVVLSPFLMSKFELTQDQFQRAVGTNPSFYGEGLTQGMKVTTVLNPVEQIGRTEADLVTFRLGLTMPTEVQWEAAARAGSPHRFHFGDEATSLQGRANIADMTVEALNPAWETTPGVKDGWTGHAPVGQFAPNAYGLHDMFGNIWEFVRERFSRYRLQPRAGDGMRADSGELYYVIRGGCYRYPAAASRVSARMRIDLFSVTPLQGLRLSLDLPRASKPPRGD